MTLHSPKVVFIPKSGEMKVTIVLVKNHTRLLAYLIPFTLILFSQPWVWRYKGYDHIGSDLHVFLSLLIPLDLITFLPIQDSAKLFLFQSLKK